MNLPEKIFLIDSNPSLIAEWKTAFQLHPCVIPSEGDYFSTPADCIVSPANSFGYMDGGLDRAILYEMGEEIQSLVQSSIKRKFHGELPVGSALSIKTGNSNWPYLICAPTMRIPSNVSGTLNAYLAFKAILSEVILANTKESKTISSLVCCGLATGIGGLSPDLCARQMKFAYEQLLAPAKTPTPAEIYKSESFMKGLSHE